MDPTEQTYDDTAFQLDPSVADLQVGAVDTDPPRLLDGKYAVYISDARIHQSKNDPQKRNFMVTFNLCEPQVGTKAGKEYTIPADYAFTRYMPLQQSDNPKAPDFREELAKLSKAVHGDKAACDMSLGNALGWNKPKDWEDSRKWCPGAGLVGAIVTASVKLGKASDEYAARPEIKSVTFLADASEKDRLRNVMQERLPEIPF